MDRLDRLPLPLELGPRAREARRERVRDVVVAWDHEQGPLEPAQKRRGALVLASTSTVGEIARDRDQFGPYAVDQPPETVL